MAAEVGSAPVNGYGHGTTYGAVEGYSHQANTSTSTTGYGAAPVSTAQQQADLSKEEVAWYFVESYYTTMSRSPEKLHLFFNKRSQLVSGVEEEKSSVAAGQKAIKERLSELDFQDCKVRVTNVDTQGSDTNIVIQVIGEMSNKSQPHRKFVQTFVLAAQTNGYFVLNDIFRYIKEDDEDEAAEGEVPQEAEATSGVQEPVPTAADSGYGNDAKETVQNEEEIAEVDKKLEEVKHVEEESAPAAAVNGTPEPEDAETTENEETPAAAVSVPEAKAEEVESAVAKEDIEQPEKPQDPAPTPAEQPSAAAPSAPPKPAVPRSWAQLAAGSQAAKAASPAARQAAAPAQTKPSAPAPAAATAATPAAASAPAAPAREASPDSTKEGSTGGWQTAGADHGRKQSRAHNTPAASQEGRVRAFVKNVTEEVDAEALKALLSKFGEIVYFDVARQKKAALVEYKTLAGFQAAVNANPHRIGSEEIWVEERRMPGTGYNARGGPGGARGGRGGFDSRPGQGRGDFKGTGAPRGAFGGRGGRGGSGNIAPRGGRGGAHAA